MDFLKKLGWQKLAILGSTVFVMCVGIVILAFTLSKTNMVPIYAHLSQRDSNVITLKLDSLGVPFKFNNDNSEILVPEKKVLSLRMYFAQEGLPSSGSIIGYEIFDKESALGTSQFINNINLVRALEGELARTIGSISQIENARVHLVLPKKELFSKTGYEPSASIVIKIKQGKKISKSEIEAITNLVSSAVPELTPSRVTIVDTKGQPLKLSFVNGDDSYSNFGDGVSIIEYQIAIENKLKLMIEELLTRYVGQGKVKANVSAEIDIDREVINSEIFDPDGQVVRSHKASEENEKDMPRSDNVSVANNLPNVNQKVNINSNVKTKSKSDEITNYEISKTVTNKIIEKGGLKNISVAVLVDGKYVYDKNTDKTTYQPRTQEELEKIKSLVTSAVGIDPKRGDKVEVINLKFATGGNYGDEKEQTSRWSKESFQKIIQTIVLGLVAILAILLIFRPLIMKLLESHKEKELNAINKELDFSDSQDSNNLKNTDNLEGGSNMQIDDNGNNSYTGESDNNNDTNEFDSGAKRYNNMIKYLNDLVSKYPNEAASVIRGWIYKDNNET